MTVLTAVCAVLIGGGCGDSAPGDGDLPAGNESPGTTFDADSGSNPVVVATDAGSPAEPIDAGSPTSSDCLASTFLASLGKDRFLVGGDVDDTLASQTPLDVRYHYLAGGLSGSVEVCSSCTASCASQPGKSWWGCWQDTTKPPGQYLRNFVSRAADFGQLPMITYYQALDTTGAAEGTAEVAALQGVETMQRYFNDWRFVLQTIAGARVLLHVEPDLWGYFQRVNADPHRVPVAVASANPTDCADQENSAAGFGRCLVAMTRKYAPNAKVGLHASGWATGIDALYNRDPAKDLAAEARAVGTFLLEAAPEADFVGVDPSDRDAGYYASVGKDTWWDATDARLPNFSQAFAWTRALTETLHKPAVWWQVPLGNSTLPDQPNAWKDNRVETLFARPADLAAANTFAMVFGAGRSDQTRPTTDGGLFVSRVRAYREAGGAPACR